LLWFASEASQGVPYLIRLRIAFDREANQSKASAHRSLRGRNRANIRPQPIRLKEIKKMERTELANSNGHLSSVSRALPRAGKKSDVPARSNAATALRKKVGRNQKPEKLVCRYCGSDDLAPSFIKRRDRRCRKCFAKRYGSAARSKKAKIKK
jgi:hypothetical protein